MPQDTQRNLRSFFHPPKHKHGAARFLFGESPSTRCPLPALGCNLPTAAADPVGSRGEAGEGVRPAPGAPETAGAREAGIDPLVGRGTFCFAFPFPGLDSLLLLLGLPPPQRQIIFHQLMSLIWKGGIKRKKKNKGSMANMMGQRCHAVSFSLVRWLPWMGPTGDASPSFALAAPHVHFPNALSGMSRLWAIRRGPSFDNSITILSTQSPSLVQSSTPKWTSSQQNGTLWRDLDFFSRGRAWPAELVAACRAAGSQKHGQPPPVAEGRGDSWK